MRVLRLLGLVGLAAILSGPALATTYDAVAGFSATNNPNSVWSYRAGTTGEPLLSHTGTVAGTFTASSTPSSLSDWANTDGATPGFPGQAWVVDNNTASDSTNNCCGSILYHAHTLSLDGQSVGSIIRFTAATAGTYSITGLFESNDTSMMTHNVGVIENGSTALVAATSLVNGSQVTFKNLPVTLAVGDYVDFISYGFSGGSYGNTGLQVALSDGAASSSVPEPAPWMLLATGLLSLLASTAMRRCA